MLRQRCGSVVEWLIMNKDGLEEREEELCFYGVENSRGYRGDASIRHLVAAIEKAALSLPSINQKVPLEWLHVYDELRRCSTCHI